MGKRVEHEGCITDIIGDESLKWLKGRDKAKPFLLMCQHKAPHHVRPHYGVVTDQYKLVRFYGPYVDYWELYDRKKNPQELKGFFGDPDYARITEELKAELQRLRTEIKVPEKDGPWFSGNTPRRKAK